MKKLVMLLITMGLIGNAAAANMSLSPLFPTGGHFSLGITDLYLQPSVDSSQLDYGTSRTLVSTLVDPTNRVQNQKQLVIDPHYHHNFLLNLGYQLPCDGNSINFSYLRLNSSDTATTNGLLPARINDTTTNVPTLFQGHSKIDLKQIDLSFGHMSRVFDCFQVDILAGLRYTNLDRFFSSNGTLTFVVPPSTETPFSLTDMSSFSTNQTDKFWGVGPLFGASGNYYFSNCFGVTGQFNSALVVGRPHFKTSNVESILLTGSGIEDGVPVVIQGIAMNTTNITSGPSHSVVPVVDGKIGAFFKTNFYGNTQVVVEGGYKGMHYWNIINNSTNLSYKGPYLGASISV